MPAYKFVVALALFAALAGSARAAAVEVTEANGTFDHPTVTLRVGEAIVAHNNDSGDHNLRMVDEDGEATDLGVQHPGKTIRLTFASSGQFKIRCSIAPDMRMTVRVSE